MLWLYFSQGIDIRFHPEVIIVGPDPVSGLLTRRFTVYHEIKNVSSQTIAGPLGEVVLQTLDTTAIVRSHCLNTNSTMELNLLTETSIH